MASNAIKFTPEGGEVVIAAFQRGDELVVEVRDTGPCIAEGDQARLFERFFRTSEARLQRIPGNGLGLSIVQAIIAQNRGQVACRSRVGQGSTFGFSLPLGGEAAEASLSEGKE